MLTSWIEGIDVNRQIDWFGSANTVFDLFNDAVHSNGVDFTGLHNLKATISIILIVAGPAQSCADTSVNVGIICKQAFLRCMVEVRPMVDASDLARGSSKDFWLPSIKMRVEVDHRDGTVSAVDGAEEGQGDCVVATKCNYSGEGLPILCWTFLFGIGCWSTGQDRIVPLFNLVESPCVVISARQ